MTTIIRIQEESTANSESPNAKVIFNNKTVYPATISDPFSYKEEEKLEWYFEKYLSFPFVKTVQAQTAAQSILTYGEKLFNQVFADRRAYSAYADAVHAGLHTIQFEIVGSPSFHRYHWEALKDPERPQPLALHTVIVRQSLEPQPTTAYVRSSSTIHLLIVTARPLGTRDVGYRTISRPLVEGLRTSNIPIKIDIVRPGTYRTLVKHLEHVKSGEQVGGYYHVIHFDMHGSIRTYDEIVKVMKTYKVDPHFLNTRFARPDLHPYAGKRAFLFFENERGENVPDPVEASELADLLTEHHIPIAILNACQSGKQVGADETSLGNRLMTAGIQTVLAMGYSVSVSAAQLLMKTLYTELFGKQDLSTSIRRARLELYNNKGRRGGFNRIVDLEDWVLPVIYQHEEQYLDVQPFTPEQAKEFYGRQLYEPPPITYEFVGRDLDILQIEKRLLTKRNILLLRGMGGAGKTTLLHHLAYWWQTTGLVDQVFFFGYEKQAYSRQHILLEIARQVIDSVEFVRLFQPLSIEAQQRMITQKLRSERHLLVLDNLESITGVHLAIDHKLPLEEQQALHHFLKDLEGGKTLVLLGSRANEQWLSSGTFDTNVYDLPGLDAEASSILADLILERYKVTQYRQDSDFLKLLRLLHGYPLALEVVLANLTLKSPKEILEDFRAGHIELDSTDSQEKTKSILKCIEYSHSNLSQEAHSLLLCLAPFTSVINVGYLEDYTKFLQQQPALASLPFDRWIEVIQEASGGLLSPDSKEPNVFFLQPTFPFFLRTILNTPEQAKMKQAIEIAFRQLYDFIGRVLSDVIDYKDSKRQSRALEVTQREYENLLTALRLSLEAHDSIIHPYLALSFYLNAISDLRRGQELDQLVLDGIESNPAVNRKEAIRIVGTIANRKQGLRQLYEAEVAYLHQLRLIEESTSLDERELKKLKTTLYHNLGLVYESAREWKHAENYFQQALNIMIELGDNSIQTFP